MVERIQLSRASGGLVQEAARRIHLDAHAVGVVRRERRLRSVAGVSGAVAARIRLRALGDADAVPVGDPIARDLVVHAFTGARRGTDAQMLELLEPWAGQRQRAIRLILASGVSEPRKAPRLHPEDHRAR